VILALDHLIFGNGHGLASPYHSAHYYWLADTSREDRHAELYTFMSGFGAQLHSIQWTHPSAGETRRLIGRDFRPFHSRRQWGRVMVAWCTNLPDDLDAANAELRQMKRDLQSAFMDEKGLNWSVPASASAPAGGEGLK
jgi:hypothetical protein